MKRFNIFIDESGSSSPSNWRISPYFTLCGLVINEVKREKLEKEVGIVKQRYFGRKSYVFHSVDLNRHLKTAGRIKSFADSLEELLQNNSFFLLYVVVDQKKAFKRSWVSTTVYKNAYNVLVGNLVKFLIAKDVSGRICAEASTVHQDIFLYQSFFNYISQGISRLGIKSSNVKQHLTEVSFVTKINNDSEEQLADLFSVCGRMSEEIRRGERSEDSLSPITKVLINQMNKKLFKGDGAKLKKKKKIYKEMNSFILLP